MTKEKGDTISVPNTTKGRTSQEKLGAKEKLNSSRQSERKEAYQDSQAIKEDEE